MMPEEHPLLPFLPEGASIMMLGSFPPQRKRWQMNFYYPNFQNDMWRIFGGIFFDDTDYFLTVDKKSFDRERIEALLVEKKIAVGDMAQSVVRQKDNASDKFLEIVEPVSPAFFLEQLPQLKAFVTTGQKATDVFSALTGVRQPPVGGFSDFIFANRSLRLYRMPSSSRAYPMALVAKIKVYRIMFEELEVLISIGLK